MIYITRAGCRLATVNDVPEVARIHVAAFTGFFLTKIGFKFLCVMYRAFLCNANCIFVVAHSADGKLVGFAVGGLRGQKDRWLAVRFLPQFIGAVFPAVLRHPFKVAKRLWARFFDESESPLVPVDAAILRSIGVLPSIRGTGVAASLLQAFEALALSKRAGHVFLTTDEINNERALRFYQKNNYTLDTRFKQDGERRMCLMSKKIS
jgi:GNAT superfamily N-acetyltransferase